tara:strand:- start:228 stop:491 length:264 start_codon:yes stop_codon:yes gene_type:complete
MFFSYIILFRPVLKKNGRKKESNNTTKGCIKKQENNKLISLFNKGVRTKKKQKIIKKIIIEGFGLIRCFKNIFLFKIYITLPQDKKT